MYYLISYYLGRLLTFSIAFQKGLARKFYKDLGHSSRDVIIIRLCSILQSWLVNERRTCKVYVHTHSFIKPSQDAVITFDYWMNINVMTPNRTSLAPSYRFMWEPFVCNEHFRVTFQARLDTSRSPVPNYQIPRSVSTADPFAVR